VLLGRVDKDVLQLLEDSPYHCDYSRSDVDRLIEAPIRNGKAMGHYEGDKLTSLLTWAFLDPEQTAGYLSKTKKLEASYFEQNEGELWFIEFIAPYGNVKNIIKAYQKTYNKMYPDITTGKMFRRAKGYDARVIVRAR